MADLPPDFVPQLRQGVDVYIVDEDRVTFVYLATRRRITVGCKPELVDALAWLDGSAPLESLESRAEREFEDVSTDQYRGFIEYLVDRTIVVSANWKDELSLNETYRKRLDRQLSFLLDLAGSPEQVEKTQQQIRDAEVVVFGVGGVGSWITRLLAMVGFRHFVLMDGKLTTADGLAREASFRRNAVGNSKVETTASLLREIAGDAQVETHHKMLRPETDIEALLDGSDVVVNTADEPYIGYTNLRLSRWCVANGTPLLSGGGFDAHLGSFGELVVPGQSPCADCYTEYFSEALQDWNPIEHPVEDRGDASGGLASLSAFSACQGVFQLLQYFAGPDVLEGGRKEFLFPSYQIDQIPIERDPECKACSDGSD